ncbi:hypothetical protein ACFPTO_02120 [Paraburkholderia denitrificans]|uniref:Uncharacterized protein n=1 Tax=Paraburkholderia denitrificans TaxID=694025 RepID=A0ABW0J3K3_9BURK
MVIGMASEAIAAWLEKISKLPPDQRKAATAVLLRLLNARAARRVS